MDIKQILEEKDVGRLADFVLEHDLIIRDGKLVARNSDVQNVMKTKSAFFDQRQQARKIL